VGLGEEEGATGMGLPEEEAEGRRGSGRPVTLEISGGAVEGSGVGTGAGDARAAGKGGRGVLGGRRGERLPEEEPEVAVGGGLKGVDTVAAKTN
jgi:hypothetical protein